MAETVSLTETALRSIIHRIQIGYPDYLIVREATDVVELSPNGDLQKDVRQFLADGGFTAINEQEFRDYYATEMEEFTRLQKLKSKLQQYGWMKLTAGILLTISTGFAAAILAKSRKRKTG